MKKLDANKINNGGYNFLNIIVAFLKVYTYCHFAKHFLSFTLLSRRRKYCTTYDVTKSNMDKKKRPFILRLIIINVVEQCRQSLKLNFDKPFRTSNENKCLYYLE